MVRSAHVFKINPEVVYDVIDVLMTPEKEYIYDRETNLGLYIKNVENRENYSFIEILIDYVFLIIRKERKKGELISKSETIKTATRVPLAYFPTITGSFSVDHVTVILSKKSLSKLLATAISRIVGREAFLRISFDFSPSKEQAIVNQFDDIVRITSEDVADMRINGLTLKGHSLYAAPEYRKAFTGIVRYLGVRIENNWFLIARDGRIITYKNLDNDNFIEYIYKILRKLAHASAIII